MISFIFGPQLLNVFGGFISCRYQLAGWMSSNSKIWQTCVSKVIVFCVTPIVPESFMIVSSTSVLVKLFLMVGGFGGRSYIYIIIYIYMIWIHIYARSPYESITQEIHSKKKINASKSPTKEFQPQTSSFEPRKTTTQLCPILVALYLYVKQSWDYEMLIKWLIITKE